MENLDQLLRERAAQRGQDIFLVCPGQELSYADLERQVGSVAAGLAGLGLAPGERAALLLGNGPHFLRAWWGLMRLGAVMMPVNLRLTAKEAAYVINHCGARLAVTGPEAAPILAELRALCPQVRTWLGPQDLDRFLELPPRVAPSPAGPEDLASILYTSGTTGFPKGVIHSQANYLRTAAAFMATTRLGPSDRLLTANPLFHVNAQFYSVLGSLLAGATCILMEKFSASRMWDWTREYRANKVVMLLALTTILYNREPRPDDAANPVELVVAGGAPKGHYHDFERRFGVKLQTLYSLSEAPLAVMGHPDEPCVEGAVGRPMLTPPEEPNQFRVADGEGRDLPAGEAGEILLRNHGLMKGYFQDTEATAKAFLDGWLRTGDRGMLDPEGRLYFLGRIKDVIRVKGENVSALEVEQALVQHPAVEEVAVVGMQTADSAGEEVILACVVCQVGQEPDWPALVEFAAGRLAGFKVPRLWQAWEALPKNAMNRVVKAELVKAGAAGAIFDRGR
ncbi:MAG: AMP-binding protein [Deltaproteobacteria bacterium]|nr:AMP-binding protein [Deltaproteobacteria bacterium]